MNIALRPFLETDLDHLVHHANNPNIARWLTNRFPHPYTPDDGSAFLRSVIGTAPMPSMAITVDGALAGSIGVHQQSDIRAKNAEMGYWVAEPYWGRGIATEAVKRMLDYGFATFDITRVFATVFEGNEASKRVLLNAGFVFEAHFSKTLWKNGVALDEWVYGFRKR